MTAIIRAAEADAYRAGAEAFRRDVLSWIEKQADWHVSDSAQKEWLWVYHKRIAGLPMLEPLSGGGYVGQLREALEAIRAEPYGCPFCDSGKLRNPTKGHTDTCGWLLMEKVLALPIPERAPATGSGESERVNE